MHPTGAHGLGGAQVIRSAASPRPAGYIARDAARRATRRAGGGGRAAGEQDPAAAAPRQVLIVAADGPPALAMPAAGLAAESGAPILLVDAAGVPPATSAALRACTSRRSTWSARRARSATRRPVELRHFGLGRRRDQRRRPVSNAIAVARFTDGTFGWGIKEPGHGWCSPTRAPAGRAGGGAAVGERRLRPAAAARRRRPTAAAAGRATSATSSPATPPRPQFRPVRGVYNHGWLIGDERRSRPSRRPRSTRCWRSAPRSVASRSSRRTARIEPGPERCDEPSRGSPTRRRSAQRREVTVEDVRQLMGASTPHFALQLRNRIATLIAGLPAGHPARLEGEREIARLQRLGFERRDPRRGPRTRASARCPRSPRRLAPERQRAQRQRAAEANALAAGVEEARAQEPEQRQRTARTSIASRREAERTRRAREGGDGRAPPAEWNTTGGSSASSTRVRAIAAEVLAERRPRACRSAPRRARRTAAGRCARSRVAARSPGRSRRPGSAAPTAAADAREPAGARRTSARHRQRRLRRPSRVERCRAIGLLATGRAGTTGRGAASRRRLRERRARGRCLRLAKACSTRTSQWFAARRHLPSILAPMLRSDVHSSSSPEPATGIPGSALPGPFPVGEYAAALRTQLRVVRARAADRRAREPACGARARLLRAARRQRRDPLRRLAQRLGDDAAQRAGAAAEGMQVVVAGGCDYYPGSATSSPASPSPSTTCASPARATCSRGSTACARLLDAEGLLERQKQLPRAAAAAHDRRGDRRERQGARRRARRARRGAAGRGGWSGRSPPCRTATRRRDHPRAAGPRRGRRGRGGDRRARRRLAGRPAVLLRRDAVPHGRAAERAGDRVGRPSHRPHAARRRRGRELLDPDARRGGGRRRRLRPRARESSCARAGRARLRDHGRRARCCDTRARRLARALLARARRARLERQRARLHQQLREIRAGSRRRAGRRARADRATRAGARRARPTRRCSTAASAARASSSSWRSRSPATTRSARSSAATRWSQTRAGEPITSAPRRARRPRSCGCASPTASARRRSWPMSDDDQLRSDADERCTAATDPQRDATPAPLTYEAAAARVEEIIRRLDSGEASLERDARAGQRGQGADRAVRARAEAVGGALEELRLDELVARLETRGGGDEHLGAPGRAAGRDRGLRARGAATRRVERLRAQEHRDPTCAAPAMRASARTSPTTPMDHEILQAAGPTLPLAGSWTLASFCEHLAALELFPRAPAARGLAALPQLGV